MTRRYVVIEYSQNLGPEEAVQLSIDGLHGALSSVFLAVNSFVKKRDQQLTYLVVGPRDFQSYAISQAEAQNIQNNVYQDFAIARLKEDEINALLERDTPLEPLAYYYVKEPLFQFGPSTVVVDLSAKYPEIVQDEGKHDYYSDGGVSVGNIYQEILDKLPPDNPREAYPYADLNYQPRRWSWALRGTSLRTRPDNRPMSF